MKRGACLDGLHFIGGRNKIGRRYGPSFMRFRLILLGILFCLATGGLRAGTPAVDVDISRYKPFSKDAKLARLDRPAELTYSSDDTLPRLDGAVALYPLYAAFAETVYPQDDYSPTVEGSAVRCGNTIEAYRRLSTGKADVIFVAEPSAEQRGEARDAGVDLRLFPVGREAFVFFVRADNPVSTLSLEQIRGIYAGKIRNWREVGGSDKPIRAYQRNANSGSQTMFLKVMADKTPMRPPMERVQSGMGGVINRVADYRNESAAIGFSFRFFAVEMVANAKIKLLAIDGVYPDAESIRSGEYPLASEFYAITAGEPRPEAKALLDWVVSEEGQELVEKTGYVPLR